MSFGPSLTTEGSIALVKKGMELLPLLSSVTVFWMSIHRWLDAPRDVKDLLEVFLHNVTEFTFKPHSNSFDDACEIISQAPSLNFLSLDQASALKYDNQIISSFVPPRIQNLDVFAKNALTLCTWLGSHSRLAIHTLRLQFLDLQPEGLASVSSALGEIGPALEDLRISIISTSGSFPPFSGTLKNQSQFTSDH